MANIIKCDRCGTEHEVNPSLEGLSGRTREVQMVVLVQLGNSRDPSDLDEAHSKTKKDLCGSCLKAVQKVFLEVLPRVAPGGE